MLVDFHVQAAHQILKDGALDDAAPKFIDVFQSLNYLSFLAIKVILNETWCQTASLSTPRNH